MAQPLNAGEKVHKKKDISGKDATSAVPTTVLQPVASTTKGKKQKGKNTQGSGPASPSPSAFNSTDSSSEPDFSSTMQEMLNPVNMTRGYQ